MAGENRVIAGDPFEPSADAWNSFVDAAQYVRGQAAKTGRKVGAAPRSPEIVKVYNGQSTALNRFQAAMLWDMVTEPPNSSETEIGAVSSVSGSYSYEGLREFLQSTVMTVRTPNGQADGRWVVLLDPLPVSGFGRAVVAGAVPCRVNLGKLTDTHCMAVSGSQIPRGGNVGVPILHVRGGVGAAAVSGEQWAVVRMGQEETTAVVKITGNLSGGGKYNGAVMVPGTSDVSVSGDLGVSDLGVSGAACLVLNAPEQGVSTHDIGTNTYWPGVVLKVNADGKAVVMINRGGSSGIIPVRLTQTGGSAGNATTPCSFSYTVKDITNTDTFGTSIAMTGNGQRVVNAAMTAGTYGMAYFHTDGTIRLMWADEKITQTNCT